MRNCIENMCNSNLFELSMKMQSITYQETTCTTLLLTSTYRLGKIFVFGRGEENGMLPEQFKSELISLLPRLKRYAITLTRSTPDADDLVQEVCMNALRKWEQYDATQPLDRWLFTILRNQWISEIRKRKVRVGQGQVPAEDALELSSDNNADDAILVKQVQGKILNLPSELSQPLLLVCAEGYSYLEASNFLKIPIGTVMSRIHRARKIISAEFEGAL